VLVGTEGFIVDDEDEDPLVLKFFLPITTEADVTDVSVMLLRGIAIPLLLALVLTLLLELELELEDVLFPAFSVTDDFKSFLGGSSGPISASVSIAHDIEFDEADAETAD
jgi:hypothetical protein